jgi:N-acyl-D-amino-acid deacylase
MFDIVIKNGCVIDGTKAPRFKADVAIQGEEIAAIGEIDPTRGDRVIDASNRGVAPWRSHGSLYSNYRTE